MYQLHHPCVPGTVRRDGLLDDHESLRLGSLTTHENRRSSPSSDKDRPFGVVLSIYDEKSREKIKLKAVDGLVLGSSEAVWINYFVSQLGIESKIPVWSDCPPTSFSRHSAETPPHTDELDYLTFLSFVHVLDLTPPKYFYRGTAYLTVYQVLL